MRSLDRNKQIVYFKNFTGETAYLDEDGNEDGTKVKTYSSLKTARLNVSAARGTYEVEQFGQNANYSKTMVTTDMSCEIDENSILWLDFGASTPTTQPHNYIVVGVAKSLNSITYAVREVKVNG